jgi:transcriptional regulator with XRE-family HTH domain
MVTGAPPARRRLVGRALRGYREGLGYTLQDASVLLECDASKLSRIETGERGIRPKELRELLGEYGVAGRQEALLAELADPRGAYGWFRDYADVLAGSWRDYLIVETAAAKIAGYEAQRVPALLQTRAYARALAETDPALDDDDARDRAAEAVLARQHAILQERRPEVRLFLGEAALHQQVGGKAVMSRQLSALAKAAADGSSVTVQVLPFDSGAHAATGDGSLAVVQFAEAPGLGIVHLGGISGGVCLEGPGDLAAYARAFEQLRAFALSPAQSALLLRGLAGD